MILALLEVGLGETEAGANGCDPFPAMLQYKHSIDYYFGPRNDDGSVPPVDSRLWYNWPDKRQRLDHPPMSHQCQKYMETEEACSIITVDDEMWAHIPSEEVCCIIEHMGLPRPDFGLMAKYQGEEEIEGYPVHWWIMPEDPMELWQTLDGTPKRFGPTNRAHSVWNYDPETYFKVSEFEDGWFDLPEYCSGECPFGEEAMAALAYASTHYSTAAATASTITAQE